MNTDAELLRRYAEHRSEEAIAELVHRHLGPVYAVALRKVGGRAHLAQDVAQAVFTELARHARPLSRHVALTGWLFRSTHFIAAKTLRAERRRQSREQEAYLMHEPTTGQPSEIDWESLRPLLDDLINELNEGDRRALLLRYFEGCTLSQIGTHLNLTERGAQAKVQRALDKLSARLARRGVKSTEAALAAVLATQAAVAVPAGLAATVTGAALTVAAGSGAALTILTFMNTKTIAAGAIVLLIGTSLIVERQIAKPAPSIAKAPTEQTAAPFDKKLGNADSNPQLQTGFPPTTPNRQLGPPRGFAVGDPPVRRDGGAGSSQLFTAPPRGGLGADGLAARAVSIRSEVGHIFSSLLEHFNLPDDKLAAFSDLLTIRLLLYNDLVGEIRGQMIEVKATSPIPLRALGYVTTTSDFSVEDKANWPEAEQAAYADTDRQVKLLLGNDAYAYYQFYQDTLGLRAMIINHLQTHLSIAGLPPLTNEQADAILRVMAAGNPHWPSSNSFTNLQVAGTVTALDGIVTPQQAKVIAFGLAKEVDYYAEVGRQIAAALAHN